MELNTNKNDDKNKFRSKSLANNFLINLSKNTEKRSSNMLSSVSKKTPGFNDRLNFFHRNSKRLLSQKMNNGESIRLRHSTNDINQCNKSQEISMQNIHDKSDVNVNCTNINISIVNPNFSINNFEPRHSAANLNNNKINVNIINNSLLSFNDNDDKIEQNESKIKPDLGKKKIISSIYKDYIENKSQEESFPPNLDENQKIKFKKYLTENQIVQHEYKTKGIISGFSAYMYPNEETLNKDKICLNINVDKLDKKKNKDKNNTNSNPHIINYFSLFCGGKNDQSDELPKLLKNKLKDMILNNKDIIKNPQYAIKKGLFNAEIDFINYFIDEKINEPSNFFKALPEKQNLIPHCSVFVLLNIDDIIYIGNIGKITTLLSSDFSKKINYLSKEYISHNPNKDEIEDNNINSLIKNKDNIFFDENTKKDIEIFNNAEEGSNINILMEKSNNSILSNSISNKMFPKLNIKRIFPGNAIYKILNKKNRLHNNKNKITNLEIYDKYKRRSSASIINLMNVLNHPKNKINKFNNHVTESSHNSMKISNSTKFLPFLIRNNNLVKSNLNESTSDKKIISSYPDVLSFKYQKNQDFILICSKKIIENMGYNKICKGVYETMKKCIKKNRSFEIFLGAVVKDIIKKSISLGITTNISCIFICFESIKNIYLKHDINVVEKELVSFYLTSNHQKRIGLYNNLLNFDLINMDKSNKYEKKIKNEFEALSKKKKSILSAIDIKDRNKVLYNNFVKDKHKIVNIEIKDKENIKKKKKRCCCIIV